MITEIFENFTKAESLLPGLAGGNEFGFGGRQRDIVLTAALPRDVYACRCVDVYAIRHKDAASV